MNAPATKVVPALARMLREKMFDSKGEIIYVREAAARLLAGMGEDAEPAVPALKEMMEDADSYTRQQAALALWQITNDPQIVTQIAEILKDTADYLTWIRLLKVLQRIGPPAVSILPDLESNMSKMNDLPEPQLRTLTVAFSQMRAAVLAPTGRK